MGTEKVIRIAVAGGTGLAGRCVVEAAQAAGHQTVVISRSAGVDLLTGVGLAAALDGADAVIDVSNTPTLSRSRSVRFFETVTGQLLAAEAGAGVRHHVALSIVGVDRVPVGYYAGKLRQEALIETGVVPWTVLRATQFHEFPAQQLARIKGPLIPVLEAPAATVAAREVAAHLVALAVGPARGHVPDRRPRDPLAVRSDPPAHAGDRPPRGGGPGPAARPDRYRDRPRRAAAHRARPAWPADL
jgi:uncharacterized protein YbjT (DUF2867 family)